jgi:hypothetical protein
MVSNIDNTGELWHHQFVHTNFGTLHHMSRLRMVDGLPLIQPPSDVCEGCIIG